ncbi:RagB/SusD family nutrient uptake outer membrane protein [Pedobacter nutrimenti]|uniref:RagB/SusD family nutrient uptake outer membrane protein n=1 Tax=Pedobacter nutrimenti TaxID=1241337 RepID=UPI0029312938|nr:RagB/SusD family nutrient uptake outer membrane protein [Pedobacter nutrimenti]
MLRYTKYIAVLLLIVVCSCTKSDFLDKKPNTNIVVPVTLDDMTQLLDNVSVLCYNTPATGIMSADEYYYPTKEIFDGITNKTTKNCYTWNKDIYQGEKNIADWNAPYQAIFYTNVVLEAWNKLSNEDKESEKGKFVKAWALFDRSYNYFNLVQIFAPTYDLNTADQDLGVPLHKTADINDVQQRASVKETYNFILSDLTNSITLFSTVISTKFRNRPSKSAAYALLARISLFMRDYPSAMKAADNSLSTYDNLIDYNTLDSTAFYPFPVANNNVEVLLYSITNLNYGAATLLYYGRGFIDSGLISLYKDNDLRKPIFFQSVNGSYRIKSAYTGDGLYPFTGLAVDEIYLIKSECQARSGDVAGALTTLNKLLIARYKTGTFVPYDTQSVSEALKIVLTERRKELIWRGLRWNDIKRLNKEGNNIVLKRIIDGTVYTLPPNDPKYIMPIPEDEIALSHIQQNQR